MAEDANGGSVTTISKYFIVVTNNLTSDSGFEYTLHVKIEFDPVKSGKNAKERGLPFDAVDGFSWETALVSADDRSAYPEPRFVALGFIGERLHVVCFTPVVGGIRVISFRKANEREVKRYEQETADK